MRDEVSVTYEQMLSELQALLGTRVAVLLVLNLPVLRERPVVFMTGVLRYGDTDVFRELPSTFTEGEWIQFALGDKPSQSADLGSFFMHPDDFESGVKYDDGTLGFRVGNAVVSVSPIG